MHTKNYISHRIATKQTKLKETWLDLVEAQNGYFVHFLDNGTKFQPDILCITSLL